MGAEPSGLRLEPGGEIPPLDVGAHPGALGDGEQTGEELVEQVLAVEDELGPHRGLDAEEACGVGGGQLEDVARADRAEHPRRLGRRIARDPVEVQPGAVGVDPVMPAAVGERDPARASPGEDHLLAGGGALEQLVPGGRAAPPPAEHGARMIGEHPLQAGTEPAAAGAGTAAQHRLGPHGIARARRAPPRDLGAVAEAAHELGVGLPQPVLALVPADVDEAEGEQVHDDLEHLGDEVERLLPRPEQVVGVRPVGRIDVRQARVAELGMGTDRGGHVAGQIDLGHDLDAELSGMLDHRGDVLRTVGAVEADLRGPFVGRLALLRQDVAVPAVVGAGQVRPDARQPRTPGDLEAPAGVVGEMPVQAVEAVARHELEELMDHLDTPAGPRRVEHQTAPLVCGAVRGARIRDQRSSRLLDASAPARPGLALASIGLPSLLDRAGLTHSHQPVSHTVH